MRSFLKWLVIVPLALVAIGFAFANRQSVTVSFDPFAGDVPAFALGGPLFVVLIVTVVLGVVIGGVTSWLGQARHRRDAREARRDAEALRSELARLQGEAAAKRGRGEGTVSFPALPGQNAA